MGKTMLAGLGIVVAACATLGKLYFQEPTEASTAPGMANWAAPSPSTK